VSHSASHVQAASDPNAACAGCHREIYQRFRKTPMANASGAAADGFMPASYTHGPSGVSYRIEEDAGRVYLKFERDAEVGAPVTGAVDRSLKGQRELRYFLGSGKRGRTYLFEQDGYWFEIPINWYGKKRVWDMTPGHLNDREMPLTLRVDPGCLRCHATEAQTSLPEARNKYAAEPFRQGGITCTACHGDATAHVTSGGRTALMKLDGLPAVRRDSVCLSCHLEGEETVVHAGKRLVDFRPGESIFDYASFFVQRPKSGETAGAGQAETRATSQWEALLLSGCKRGAGERMTCTSCHDPHGSTNAMTEEEQVAFYRGKCLACHDPGAAMGKVAGKGFAASHHPEKADCTACHMPRVTSSDIAHEQVTDHQILLVPRMVRAEAKIGPLRSGELVEVGTGDGPALSSGRDLGIAYALAGEKSDKDAAVRAMEILREAAKLPGAAADDELHAQLAFFDQVSGDKEEAQREYGLALAANANDAFAAGNLGLIKAGEHQYGEAMGLWARAFQNDPAELQMGMNLAIVECGVGKKEAALVTLGRLLDFSPDYGKARTMVEAIRSGRNRCGGK
jgi:hypothetical protein